MTWIAIIVVALIAIELALFGLLRGLTSDGWPLWVIAQWWIPSMIVYWSARGVWYVVSFQWLRK